MKPISIALAVFALLALVVPDLYSRYEYDRYEASLMSDNSVTYSEAQEKLADFRRFQNRNHEAEVLVKQLLAEAKAPSYKDRFVSTTVEGKLKRLYENQNRHHNATIQPRSEIDSESKSETEPNQNSRSLQL